MSKLKRILLAGALMASSLIGATAVSAIAPSTVGAVTTNGPCNGNRLGLDWGWHLAGRSGYSYHMVEDDYAAYTINNQCTYTIHVNVDVCNGAGCYLSVFEAWIPYWGEVKEANDYSFKIRSSTPTSGSLEGVWLYHSNDPNTAFCHISGGTCTYPGGYGGSEWEHSVGPWAKANQSDAGGYYTRIYP